MLNKMYNNPAQRLAMRILVDRRWFSDAKKDTAEIFVGYCVGAVDGEKVAKTCDTDTLR